MGLFRPLDTFTLEFALIVILIFSSCIIFTTSNLFKRRALQWTSAGLSICGIGFLFLSMGTEIKPLFRLGLSTLLLSSGYGLIGYGLLKDLQIYFKAQYFALSIVLEMIAVLLFLTLIPSIPYFIVASSIGLCLIHGITVWYLIKAKNKIKGTLMPYLILLNVLFVSSLIYRAYTALQMISINLNDADPTLKLYATVSLLYITLFSLLLTTHILKDFKRMMKKHMNQLQQLTFTDPLTGVHNKRSVMRIISAEKERISRYDSKCCLAIIDLDHFKNVNDTYGHLYGDHVLKTFAQVGIDQLRSFDTVARYGGEEFLLVLPETDLYQGMLIADRLRKAVSDYKWDKEGFRQTICVGVIEINKENCDTDIGNLIDNADEALYVAKKNGRNHVEAAVFKPSA